jgi:hypothetical protein
MNLQHLRIILTSFPVIYSVGVVGGGLVGAGITQLVLTKKIEAKYAAISNAEIAEAREMYKRRFKDGEFADLEALGEKYQEQAEEPVAKAFISSARDNPMVQEAVRLAGEQQYVSYNERGIKPPQPEEERIEIVGSQQTRIWDNHEIVETGEYDADEEKAKQDAGKPYILEHDAFYDNADGHVQTTLTYFEEDDVLVDEHDRPIPNKDGVIGAGNLRFGCGTDQGNVVLIHNPTIGVDYEITRDKGSYSREILGYEPKERRRPVGRFRDTDD